MDKTPTVVEIVPGFSAGDVACKGCGQKVTLWYNGGELDRDECCGYVYRTEARGFQLVIEKMP